MTRKLIYSMLASLDGYTADEHGNFDWAAPDDEVHSFINDLEQRVEIYLYGRRMYETMVTWETMHTRADEPRALLDFAQMWQAANKVVYSRTLETAASARTQIKRDFDPEEVRQMKAQPGGDMSVGGPELAACALKAQLIDELQLFIVPIVVGGGTQWLPNNVRLKLELMEERRFGNGTVYLRYHAAT
jgi:dihydrofolate reductase